MYKQPLKTSMGNAVSGGGLDCRLSGLVWKMPRPRSYNAEEGTSHLKLLARSPVATSAPDCKATGEDLNWQGKGRDKLAHSERKEKMWVWILPPTVLRIISLRNNSFIFEWEPEPFLDWMHGNWNNLVRDLNIIWMFTLPTKSKGSHLSTHPSMRKNLEEETGSRRNTRRSTASHTKKAGLLTTAYCSLPMQWEKQCVWQSIMNYWSVWSFMCHLPLDDGVYRENWEAGSQGSKQLLSPDGHGNVNRGGVSKSSTAPRDWDACDRCLRWGKEGQENTKSLMLRRPQQTETCLLKCVSASMLKAAMGNMNSVPLRSETIKDFPLMGWLVPLDNMNFSGTRPWFEGCIVSFQSETSQLHMFTLFEVLFTIPSSN